MRRFIPFILLLVIVSSCKYEKLLKSRDYKLKYSKALDYYAKEDYMRAEGLFEQLKPVLRGTKQADTVYFYAAYCSYHQKSYLLASHYFDEFKKYYGNSHFVEEAEFMNAYSTYQLSPRPSLDQAYSYQTIALLGLYMSRYPDSERTNQCLDIVEELRNKLIEKSFQSAKLYFNLENFDAAIIALNNSIEAFPTTKYREEILFLVLKSKFLLAEGSVPEKKIERYQSTVDEYYAFSGEFSEGTYIEEAKQIFEVSNSKLKN
ncbi:MAG: outer membrane protein assembly factor BamD [Bacteroidales bacterium]|nr:outer membrane protein assembly factor BamD [Bacteroidales bacterium]